MPTTAPPFPTVAEVEELAELIARDTEQIREFILRFRPYGFALRSVPEEELAKLEEQPSAELVAALYWAAEHIESDAKLGLSESVDDLRTAAQELYLERLDCAARVEREAASAA